MAWQIGDRVGAIRNADKQTAYLFGYGTYQGHEVPPPGVMFMGVDLHEAGHENPKIVLDSGKVVWGCECWWGGEERTRRAIDGRTVVMVDPEENRREHAQEAPVE